MRRKMEEKKCSWLGRKPRERERLRVWLIFENGGARGGSCGWFLEKKKVVFLGSFLGK